MARMGKKSQEILRLNNIRTLVLEGAVRSGKTVVSLVKLYQLFLSSPDQTHLMFGATMGALSRNCLLGDFGLIAISGNKLKKKVDSDGSHYLTIDDKKKIYYVGADNERSYRKIQGISAGIIYGDEVINAVKSFFQMARTRNAAAVNPVDIFTLNPDSPGHWFYKDYLNELDIRKPEGYHYYHFDLKDNTALSQKRIDEIANQFTGVFYKRFVLGQRVKAEGACYPSFNEHIHVIDTLPDYILFVQFGFDIGGNKSATSLTATGFYRLNNKINIVVIDEEYIEHKKDESTRDPNIIIKRAETFILNIKSKYRSADLYIDSAEQIMKKGLSNRGVINVHNSLKKPVIDRIRFVDMMLSQNRLHIFKKCVNTIEAIQSAVFNDKSIKEERLDDSSSNIDSLDSFEYSFEDKMKEIIQ